MRLLIAVRDLIAPVAELRRTAEIGLRPAICARRDVLIHPEDTLSKRELDDRLVVAFATCQRLSPTREDVVEETPAMDLPLMYLHVDHVRIIP